MLYAESVRIEAREQESLSQGLPPRRAWGIKHEEHTIFVGRYLGAQFGGSSVGATA